MFIVALFTHASNKYSITFIIVIFVNAEAYNVNMFQYEGVAINILFPVGTASYY